MWLILPILIEPSKSNHKWSQVTHLRSMLLPGVNSNMYWLIGLIKTKINTKCKWCKTKIMKNWMFDSSDTSVNVWNWCSWDSTRASFLCSVSKAWELCSAKPCICLDAVCSSSAMAWSCSLMRAWRMATLCSWGHASRNTTKINTLKITSNNYLIN